MNDRVKPAQSKSKPGDNPLVRKIQDLDDFRPDQVTIDEHTQVGDDQLLAALKQRLGIGR
jgi:hypothetical protein